MRKYFWSFCIFDFFGKNDFLANGKKTIRKNVTEKRKDKCWGYWIPW